MPERDGFIPGVPCWVDASEPNPRAALGFYGSLFGWEFEDTMPPGSEGRYFIAWLRRSIFDGRGRDVAAVRSIPGGASPTAVWNSYVWVDSADEAATKVREAGGGVAMEPFDVLDAGRMAVFTDPEGAVFGVLEARQHKGARLVNDPGSLNFNTLSTRHAGRARSFYGSVFGWQTLVLDGGAEFFTLPGYGDWLERDNPGLRRRMAEAGAQEGFEDVVASIMPIAGDQPGTPAHWSVAFAVADADATAAKARQLGGEVMVPPFDAPWTRVTVIADPQGATFIASKFTPQNRNLGSDADAAVGSG
jgi:uncharacterized protein